MEEERREAPRRVRRADRYKDEERVAAEMPEIPEEAAVREVSDDTLVLAKTQEVLDDTLVLTKTQESPDDAAVLAEPQETSDGAAVPAEAQEAADDAAVLAEAAENRVPVRARQMSADPYGAVSAVSAAAVRRPGAQSQGKPRASLPPRPAAGDRGERQRVGYAPGRMSESMLQQHREDARDRASGQSWDAARQTGGSARDSVRSGGPAREPVRVAAGNRNPAKAREEERRAVPKGTRVREYPGNAYEKPAAKAYLEKGKKKNSRRVLLVVLLLLVLLIGLVAAARFVLPEGNAIRQTVTKLLPFLGERKADPIRCTSFSVSGNVGTTAPTDVTFSVVTAKDVESIRLTDDEGHPLVTTLAQGDNIADSVWILTLHLSDGYEGLVRLQAKRANEDWQDTGETAELTVASLPVDGTEGQTVNALPLAEETETPRPTEEATPEQTEGTVGEEASAAVIDGLAEDMAEPAPTARPEPTEIPTPTEAPTATPEPTATPPLTAEAAEEADPAIITTNAVYVGSKLQKEYTRAAKELIHMPVADEYSKKPMGVLTFRGDNFRRNAACGTVTGAEGLAIAWTAETGSVRGTSSTYYGVGWTGQAAIVKWSKEVREKSNIDDEKKEVSGLKEVIVAGLDGSIRYLDLSDGRLTRNSTRLGYPMRGTPSVHPGGFPYMNVGQFARKMKVKTGKIGLRQYNLYNQKELTLVDGLDGKLHRAFNNVGSFETSSLIDRTSDTVITAATNGLLYLQALNSEFDYQAGVYKMSPTTVVLRSKIKGQKDALTAVESSLAAYDKYVYYADMAGVLRCVDTDTLKAVWAVQTGDAVKAAVALDLTEDRQLNLYTANMLENRKSGSVQIRRYDALSGRNIWTTEIGVAKGKKETNDVGAKASPVIGQNGLNGLVYFTVTGISPEGSTNLGFQTSVTSALIALEKDTGRVAWAYGMQQRTESSPVAVYSDAGEGWIIQCDESGVIHLLEGLTGRVVSTLQLEGEIAASPAVYNDMMVISTTGKGDTYVYGVKILSSASAAAEAAVTATPAPTAEPEPAEEAESAGEIPPEETEYDEEPGEDAAGIG